MKESQQTKSCKVKRKIFSIIHFLLLFGPLMFFFPYGFIMGTAVTKVSMGLSVMVSIILAGISLLVDTSRRGGFSKSIMWILIAAVLMALTQVKTFIFIMAGASVVDELIVCPLRNHYRTEVIANRAIDKRMP